MGCKVTVAEFTVRRSWTGLKSSVPGFWTGKVAGGGELFQDDWQGWKIPYFKSLSKCF
jgi:hypothetical protein